ncbi:HNH endonuclease [Priestia megaterium]|uniref:HNH endonuclease n=1 Tax=Priestia megaterium TaxID=1404 RepID=UPI003CC5A9AB
MENQANEKQKKRKPRIPYEQNHKIINDVEHKKCSICEEWFPMNDDHFYKVKTNKTDGYSPYCKECTKKKSSKWEKENYDRYYKNRRKYLEGEKYRAFMRRKEEYYKAYRKRYREANRDKFKMYKERREQNKSHHISEEELRMLYDYANTSCMYCGMTEEESFEKYKQRLHRDHAKNEGSDGLDNCILACKGCNSEKHDKDWNVWYTEKNYKYNEDNYKLIKEWLDSFK